MRGCIARKENQGSRTVRLRKLDIDIVYCFGIDSCGCERRPGIARRACYKYSPIYTCFLLQYRFAFPGRIMMSEPQLTAGSLPTPAPGSWRYYTDSCSVRRSCREAGDTSRHTIIFKVSRYIKPLFCNIKTGKGLSSSLKSFYNSVSKPRSRCSYSRLPRPHSDEDKPRRSSWAELPLHLCVEIVRKLPDDASLVAFAGVCSLWREAMALCLESPLPSDHDFPMRAFAFPCTLFVQRPLSPHLPATRCFLRTWVGEAEWVTRMYLQTSNAPLSHTNARTSGKLLMTARFLGIPWKEYAWHIVLGKRGRFFYREGSHHRKMGKVTLGVHDEEDQMKVGSPEGYTIHRYVHTKVGALKSWGRHSDALAVSTDAVNSLQIQNRLSVKLSEVVGQVLYGSVDNPITVSFNQTSPPVTPSQEAGKGWAPSPGSGAGRPCHPQPSIPLSHTLNKSESGAGSNGDQYLWKGIRPRRVSEEHRYIPSIGDRDTHVAGASIQLVPYEGVEGTAVEVGEDGCPEMNRGACLQVGKVDIRLHYLDYRPPCSAFLAFSIALAQLDPLASYQDQAIV